ncbi:IS256 family transposase [Geomobilimonas luticola]|uniref:Mutator family transposase n=1 Tax=Geomobilimonas luticola TaxID=1114878 RepID=A0ABS5SAV7_9BACT|nr:IS256 family transposase [Geomobilimonas luticola]MBT0652507.1 IS256 family transposase [Geomobilimonas luticola]
MATTDELLDVLMKDYKKPEDLIGENGLLKQLTKRLLERAMRAELTEHLGYEKHAPQGKNSGNSRNGCYKKTITGDFGNLEVITPRDRNSTFEPLILPKGETRFTGFNDKIISMYARGMTTRDIQGHLQEIYGVDVSPTLISQVTDAISEEVLLWQNRPLDEVYPIVYLDAVRIKVRHDSRVINKAVYLAIAVNMDGIKEVLGMWTAENEGAKFWLQVVTELKNRGVKDIFIACVDGLKGFPEAIEAIFPKTQIQLCIVHMVRHSLSYVSWKQRKEVADDLKTIYQATTVEFAERNLEAFATKWDASHPSIAKSWRINWERIIPLFSFPIDIRKAIYTTNTIESLNMSLRKVTKNRGHFPSDEAMFKLLYLALSNIAKKWTMPIRDWKSAMNQFSIIFEERMPHH